MVTTELGITIATHREKKLPLSPCCFYCLQQAFGHKCAITYTQTWVLPPSLSLLSLLSLSLSSSNIYYIKKKNPAVQSILLFLRFEAILLNHTVHILFVLHLFALWIHISIQLFFYYCLCECVLCVCVNVYFHKLKLILFFWGLHNNTVIIITCCWCCCFTFTSNSGNVSSNCTAFEAKIIFFLIICYYFVLLFLPPAT